jgi:hypothetical protein
MRKRSKISRTNSKKLFKKTARPVKKFNKGDRGAIKRGGYRL